MLVFNSAVYRNRKIIKSMRDTHLSQKISNKTNDKQQLIFKRVNNNIEQEERHNKK